MLSDLELALNLSLAEDPPRPSTKSDVDMFQPWRDVLPAMDDRVQARVSNQAWYYYDFPSDPSQDW